MIKTEIQMNISLLKNLNTKKHFENEIFHGSVARASRIKLPWAKLVMIFLRTIHCF